MYKSYWKFFKEHISDIDLKSVEDLSSVDTNLNIPYLGKLYVSNVKIKKYQYKKVSENVRVKESEANRLSGISD